MKKLIKFSFSKVIPVILVCLILYFVYISFYYLDDIVSLSYLGTYIASLTFLLSLILIFFQIRETTMNRHLDVLLSLYDRLIRAREKRGIVYRSKTQLENITLENWKKIKIENKELAEAIFDSSMAYHLCGFYISSGFLKEKEMFLKDIGVSFLDFYNIIKPIIEFEQQDKGNTYRYYLSTLERDVKKALS